MLSDRDREILAFEEQNWVHTGRKQNDIRETFGVSAPRYYAILRGLIHDPDAVEAFPQLTKRMLERSDAHARSRARLILGPDD